jgi:hypothetical protein
MVVCIVTADIVTYILRAAAAIDAHRVCVKRSTRIQGICAAPLLPFRSSQFILNVLLRLKQTCNQFHFGFVCKSSVKSLPAIIPITYQGSLALAIRDFLFSHFSVVLFPLHAFDQNVYHT